MVEESAGYCFTQDRRELLAAKNDVFQKLIEDFPTSLGKEVSKSEREALGINESSLTYGELGETYTDFMSIGEAFDVIQHKYGGLQPEGVFYDLGSVTLTQGTGKGVLAAALLHSFSDCKGIEILEGLFGVSIRLKETYDNKFPELAQTNPNLFPAVPKVTFTHGSFFEANWSDATFFFANSTCFDLEMMARIADLPFPVGGFAITLTKNLPGSKWTVLESFRRPMSWGEATIFIQQRVEPPS